MMSRDEKILRGSISQAYQGQDLIETIIRQNTLIIYLLDRAQQSKSGSEASATR